jgi:hypothetical protein
MDYNLLFAELRPVELESRSARPYRGSALGAGADDYHLQVLGENRDDSSGSWYRSA